MRIMTIIFLLAVIVCLCVVIANNNSRHEMELELLKSHCNIQALVKEKI